MIDEITVRFARPEDAAELLGIYEPYVLNTAITFEYEVPSTEEFMNRIINTQKKYPYLVAEQGSKIIGYTYAGSFHARAAYARAVEISIYVKKDMHNNGVGRLLYEKLELALSEMHIINVYACISSPKVDDEYLTSNSIEFHEHMGYKKIGEFHKCGYKFGRWYNIVYLEKMLGNHVERPEAVRGISEIQEDYELRHRLGLKD